ncbi:MAG: EAL domain-containing protein [Candidatus Afipia apatlaquensis]|uniref:EAL domain-containing protein n=1 Tax=Candidatus Afipia apatlaquensis TaxID=2712852 RepID=A0A7C9REX6_9BRAD|nr:EAL domain-containing protein [Candidatus Afipia apatlaquensis]
MFEYANLLFVYHHGLIFVAAAVCLFGTWVGMRHFARARATKGLTRYGWLFMASLGTGAALWASIFISILSQAPLLHSGFDLAPTAGALLIAIVTCVVGFEIGSRKRPSLAPELGGLVVGAGILAMHYVGLKAWHVAGTVDWNWFGIGISIVFGLGLGALSVSRANRPVTRYCRHGAAIVMTFLVCVMHYTLLASHNMIPDSTVQLPPNLIPAHTLAIGVVGAVLLVIGSGFSSYIIDLRSRTEAADRIFQLSFNDTMTGLPNRIAFNERLAFDVSDAHEKAQKLAAFSIDIDGFKDVNDVFGHSTGDLVLIQVAERLRGILQPGEFLARQSGDEFLALQMSGNQPVTAQEFAERISAALTEPFNAKGTPVKLTASIGYAIFPTDTPERDHLLSHAKLAMHRGKTKQRGLICKYDQGMDELARDRRTLARDLHFAIQNGELALHYQIQTSLGDGSIRGAEALMRWIHPTRGFVSPADFIPLAEESELIIPMGEWALRRACQDAAAGKIPGVVAVNLSPIQFRQNDLAEKIHMILLETGLSASRLEVEVTESTLMQDQIAAIHTLRKLKSMGIAIAMDDFGTGYSSLATLHAFPFDKIKLDQSFVRKLPDDMSAVAIVRTVLALGASLKIPVLAEGIETLAQRMFLMREGCKEGQGYLMAKPAPLDRLADVIAETKLREANHISAFDEAASKAA